MAAGKLIDRDRGMAAMVKLAQKLGQQPARVVVGVTGERALSVHQGAAATVVDIAAIHEFGLGTAPERSFIRSTVDEGQAKYQRVTRDAFVDLLTSTIERRQPQDPRASQALQRLGLRVEGDIKKRIAAGIEPPLKARTVARKGSSTPLIDQGQLRASVTSLVRMEREL